MKILPPPKNGPSQVGNEMCLSNLALHHPATDLLLQYATKGCPTQTGQNWTTGEMEAAIAKGTHPSAMASEAAAQL
jgi:hypothetical protein